MRQVVLVFALSVAGCGNVNLTGDRTSEELIEEENRVFLLLVLASAHFSSLECAPGYATRLSPAVVAGPFQSGACFIVTTTGAATISVTGSGSMRIESNHPSITSSSGANPSASISGAVTDATFRVFRGSSSYTLLAN